MRKAFDHPVERFPALEPDRHTPFAAEVDDLLKPRPAGAPDHVNAVHRAAGAQSLANRMDACQWKHVARKRWYQSGCGQLKQFQ
jgi:hypothetical protein